MMLPNRVMTDGRRNEIARNQMGALMDQLVKSVLSVGPGRAPNYGAGAVSHFISVSVGMLAIALHISLLKIGGEAVHILVVRQNSFGFGPKKIGVPYSYQSHNYRYIFLKVRSSEMVIRSFGSFEQLLKIRITNC